MTGPVLNAVALNADSFAPFGEVIQATGDALPINAGSCQRFDNLARIDVNRDQGQVCLAIFRAQPFDLPHKITVMERHPLSSQAFFPVTRQRFLIVVAPADQTPAANNLRAFVSNGRQGINYAAGVWHHPLIALDRVSEFIVVDRQGPGTNCDELDLSGQDITINII